MVKLSCIARLADQLFAPRLEQKRGILFLSLNTEFVFPAGWKMRWSHITVGLFLAINAGLFLAFAFLFRDD
jgi:hypothetical protein